MERENGARNPSPVEFADADSLLGACTCITKFAPTRMPTSVVGANRWRRWSEDLVNYRLCLVRAPSGYGKSTACALWFAAAAEAGVAVGWVSFDETDDNVGRAIAYIAEAVCDASAKTAHMLKAIFGSDGRYDELAHPQLVATQFINAIHEAGETIILFLDDFDRVRDSRFTQFMSYLLLNCPDNLHLVVACQAQPTLPVTYLKAHDLLLEVGVDTLRLKDDEAQELLSNASSQISAEDARLMNEAMVGWVTGLRIGSAALRNNRDALFEVGHMSRGAQWLGDYLDENVFGHLSERDQTILKRCSVVERLSGEFAKVLSGDPEAGERLSWLSTQGLFVQREERPEQRFRIHPVFRGFLASRLNEEDPEDASALHAAAARWLVDKGRPAQAISHALEAGQVALAAELVEASAMALVERSDILTLLSWISRLPDKVIEDRVPVKIAEAWALALALRPQTRALLDTLSGKRRSVDHPSDRRRLEREIAGIDTIFLAVYEDRFEEAVESGYAFLSSIGEEDGFDVRAVRNATAYGETLRGRHDLVHELVRPAQLLARRSEQSFTTAYRHYVIASGYRAQGQLAEAERILCDGLAAADARTGRQSGSSALISALLARSYYERNDLETAAETLRGKLPIIDETCFHDAVINAYVVAVRLAEFADTPGNAAALIEHAELIGHERGWTRLLAQCFVERTRLGLPQTLTLEAFGEAAEVHSVEAGPLSLAARTFAILADALAFRALAAGDLARLEQLSIALERFATASDNREHHIRARLYRLAPSLVEDGSKSDAEALRAELNAFAMEGFVRTAADFVRTACGDKVGNLVRRGVLCSLLLAAVHRSDQAVSDVGAMNTAGTVFSILTSREIDVLIGVGRGDSNKMIARQLHLTPETVKWHLRNCMRKLGATSRVEAVRLAAGLGLSLNED